MDSSFVHVQINKNETPSSLASEQKVVIKKKAKIRHLATKKRVIDVRQMKTLPPITF